MLKSFLIVGFWSLMFLSCVKDKTLAPSCTEDFSFSEDVQPIIMNSCAVSGCHTASSAANGIVLESYQEIFDLRDEILKTIRHEAGVTAMPIGADQLSTEQIQKISCWIEQGALNN